MENHTQSSRAASNSQRVIESNNVVAPDLGNVAKVAKKEGVLEVIEADDGQEKALSSGSQFSEISVKD